MMRGHLPFFVWAFSLISSASEVLAHSEHSRVRGMTRVGNDPSADETIYGGYGYVAQSEAEAYHELRRECPAANNVAGSEIPCPRRGGASSSEAAVQEWFRPLFLQQLQVHEAELLIYQAHALGGSLNPLPSCLERNTHLETLTSFLPTAVPDSETVRNAPAELQKRLNRYIASVSPLRSEEMLRALLFSDQIESAFAAGCEESANNNYCTDLRNNRDRIHSSFPFLVEDEFSASRQAMRSSVYQILGARFSGNITPSERVRQGQQRYDALTGSASVDSLSDLETQIASAVLDATTTSDAQLNDELHRLREAVGQLNTSFRSLHDQFLRRIRRQFAGICGHSTIDHYIGSSPNLVRQSLMDAPPSFRTQAHTLLCASPRFPVAQFRESCEGVRPLSGATLGVSVDRMDWGFPFRSSNRYTIQGPRNSSLGAAYRIENTITVRADPNLSPSEVQERLGVMQGQTNAYLNCMTGQVPRIGNEMGLEPRTCPERPEMASPSVEFSIRFVTSPPAPEQEPVVALHRCYNAELDVRRRTDCRAIREYAIGQCVDSIRLWQRLGRTSGSAGTAPDIAELVDNIAMAPTVQSAEAALNPSEPDESQGVLRLRGRAIRRHCDEQYPADEVYDREDSGNYTMNTSAGTVLHEVAHTLGLPDEYSDPAYPFSPQGEHNSLMNDSNRPDSILYPRHINTMLRPLECLMRPGGSASSGTAVAP